MLARFRRYVQRVYGLDRAAGELTDTGRREPRLATAGVWLGALLMFVANYPSLHAFEGDVRRRQRPQGRQKPAGAASQRTAGRVFAGLALTTLRGMLVGIVRRLKRNKALLTARSTDGLVAAAVDGHELFASDLRHCAQCLQRRVKVKVKGRTQWRTEYYHRVVVCFLIDCLLPLILDVELIRPGEDEKGAARRLLRRVLRDYARTVDVISADALYADGSFIAMVLGAGKHVVIVLKDERREILDEARRLRHGVRRRVWREEGRGCTVWDIPGLPCWWAGAKGSLRVVWSHETGRVPRRGRAHRGEKVAESKTWVWLTDLTPAQAQAYTIWRFGHRRWHIENRCFNDAVAHWGFDHCFHHEPNAMVAFLLTLAIALVLVHAFWRLNLKPAVRPLWSCLDLRRQFFRDLGTSLSWSAWLLPAILDDS